MKKIIYLLLTAFLLFSCSMGLNNPGTESGTISNTPVISLIIDSNRGSIDEVICDVNKATLSIESPDGSIQSQNWERGITGDRFYFVINKTGLHKIIVVETDTCEKSYTMEKQVNLQMFKNYQYKVILGGNIVIVIDEPVPTLTPTLTPTPTATPTPAPTAEINANSIQQYIRGFGGANIRGWRPDMSDDQIITAFSVDNGIGMSVLRVRISPDSADWEAEKRTIDAAKSLGAMVIASAWTAPAEMKTNNDLVGGTLNVSSYADYAAHLKGFNDAVGGVSAISPINEPNVVVSYESMEMTASEVADFVAEEGNNCGAPIMAPEPYNMSQDYINEYLSNSTANANTTYLAGHIYGAKPTYFNPGKEVWMTEHYVDSATSGNDWTKSMLVAKEIHDCMAAGYSMYIWWYIVRYYGPIDEDGTITKTGYVMSHYAKWIRPGFNKISSTANPAPGIYTTAYKKGSDMVIVVINQNTTSISQTFNINGMDVSGFNAWTTTGISNLVASSFPVSGSSFTVNLRPTSITTLVSTTVNIPEITLPPETPTPTPEPTPVGLLAVELESLADQSLFSPFVVINDAAASGGQAIVWPDNNNQYAGPASDTMEGQVEIPFTLTQASDVDFYVQVNMSNGSNDSFYFKLDSNPWVQLGKETTGYEIIKYLDTNTKYFKNLAAGPHTLRIERREDGAILDKVMLYSLAGPGTIY